MRFFILLPAALIAAACSLTSPPTVAVAPSQQWRDVATPADRERIREWRIAFTRALAMARAAGHGAEIDREGALLRPDSAVAGMPIPNGLYACRVTKVGGQQEGLLDYIAYPAFRCRIQQEKDLQGFAKLTGSQRHVGLLFPDGAMRQVFLGSLVLGDEARARQYGIDPDRDVAGIVERIGEARWRMLLPYPRFESTMDVIELVPVAESQGE